MVFWTFIITFKTSYEQKLPKVTTKTPTSSNPSSLWYLHPHTLNHGFATNVTGCTEAQGNVFQMSPRATVGYGSVLLADQTYEDNDHHGPPRSPKQKSRVRRPRPDVADVSALCQHFLAAYNIRPDFFCKFQGRANATTLQRRYVSTGKPNVFQVLYSLRFSEIILTRL